MLARMLSDRQIITFDDAPPPPGQNPWVGDHRPAESPEIVAPDPQWPAQFETLRARILGALGDAALRVEHVGSTAVPELPAKPVIDVDLIVADSGDEAAYVPQLERAGFTLAVREPWWYGHRLLRHPAPVCNLHVFSTGCPEHERHLIFRDWLRSHPEDRRRYADIKQVAAAEAARGGEDVEQYNARKSARLREICQDAFQALGLLD